MRHHTAPFACLAEQGEVLQLFVVCQLTFSQLMQGGTGSSGPTGIRVDALPQQVDAQPVADERQQHGDDRVDQEPADEDPIVVDPVEFRPHRPEHRVEGRQDGDGRIATELEADVDVEDETRQDAHEEPEQG